MATDFSFARDLIDKLDGWVDKLAAPLMPPRTVVEAPDRRRLELREHRPHTVMIGKCVRAVSGIHAALALADCGYVVECAALLRMVSDFCAEITAIGEALQKGGELPRAVRTFVEHYFVPRRHTPEQFEAAERTRYVSREDLMKTQGHLAAQANLDVEQIRTVRRFLNMSFDAYVHGAYETTMELCDPETGRFMMRGYLSPSKRQEFIEVVWWKLREVVVALEFTAAVTAQAEIFQAARDARHAMDDFEPWRRSLKRHSA
ncbi:MAG: hypothetical protein AB7N91_32680 [Candidatus Tectimicrobiota bacterium]